MQATKTASGGGKHANGGSAATESAEGEALAQLLSKEIANEENLAKMEMQMAKLLKGSTAARPCKHL